MRRDIREFLANLSYQTFAKLQENARRREIELESQASRRRSLRERSEASTVIVGSKVG